MKFQDQMSRASLTAGADGQVGIHRFFGPAALQLEEQWNALVTNLAPVIPWYDRFAAQSSSAETRYERVKRLMDLAAGIALLPFAMVLLALCALAIRLD